MAIHNKSEFEVLLTTIIMKAERLIDEQPANTKLAAAKRTLVNVHQALRRGTKISEREGQNLASVTETLTTYGRGDLDLGEKVYDLVDFIEDQMLEK
jgi:hypothetical protein